MSFRSSSYSFRSFVVSRLVVSLSFLPQEFPLIPLLLFPCRKLRSEFSVEIFFNSFVSCSFFHCCSVKRRIFFMSGTRIGQQNSPVFQLMIGFCSCNQGKPRMILCFLRPVRNSRWV